MVPEIPEANKQWCDGSRKRVGEKHPQRRFTSTDEAAKDISLFQHLDTWKWSDDRQIAKYLSGKGLPKPWFGRRCGHWIETSI